MKQRIFNISIFTWSCLFVAVAPFEQRAVVPISIAFAIVCLLKGDVLNGLRRHTALRSVAICLLCLIVWMTLTLIWAPDTQNGRSTLFKFIGNCVVGVITTSTLLSADRQSHQRLCAGFLIGACLAGGYIGANLISGGAVGNWLFGYVLIPKYGFFWFKPAIALLTFCSWAIAFYLWQRCNKFWPAAAVVLFTAWFGYAVGFHATALMLAFSSSLLFVLKALKKNAFVTVFGIFTLAVAFAPLPLQHIDASGLTTPEQSQTTALRSVTHRLLIWEFVSERIGEKPIAGWGLGASKYLGATEKFHNDRHQLYTEAIPLHPHNGILQVWLELGGVGSAILCVLAFIVLRQFLLSTRPGRFEFVTAGLFATGMTYFLVSYGIWSSWWQQYIWFAVAIALNVRNLAQPQSASEFSETEGDNAPGWNT